MIMEEFKRLGISQTKLKRNARLRSAHRFCAM